MNEFTTAAELAEHFDASEDQIAAWLAIAGMMENILAGGYPTDDATAFLSRIFSQAGETPGESLATASATGGVYIARTTAAAGTHLEG